MYDKLNESDKPNDLGLQEFMNSSYFTLYNKVVHSANST